jgi:hypothetical protein
MTEVSRAEWYFRVDINCMLWNSRESGGAEFPLALINSSCFRSGYSVPSIQGAVGFPDLARFKLQRVSRLRSLPCYRLYSERVATRQQTTRGKSEPAKSTRPGKGGKDLTPEHIQALISTHCGLRRWCQPGPGVQACACVRTYRLLSVRHTCRPVTVLWRRRTRRWQRVRDHLFTETTFSGCQAMVGLMSWAGWNCANPD